MNDIHRIIEFFKENPKVFKELVNDIESSFKNKQFNAVKSSSIPLVKKSKITEESDGKVRVTPSYFSYVLFLVLKERLKYNEINDYADYEKFKHESSAFLREIDKYYNVWKDFEIFLLIFLNQTKNWDFKDYILNQNPKNDSNEYYNLKYHFALALPELRIVESNLVEILYHLFCPENVKVPSGEVYNAVKEYCIQQPANGWKILEFMVTNSKTEFTTSALVGLSNIKFDDAFSYARELFSQLEFREIAIYALGAFRYENRRSLEESLKLLESVALEEESLSAAVAKAYGQLVHNSAANDIGRIDYIFERLELFAKLGKSEIALNILITVFRWGKSVEKEKRHKLLLNFVKIKTQDQIVVNEIRDALTSIKEPQYVLEFVKYWALNHPPEDDAQLFLHPLYESYNHDPKKFIEYFICLLTHDRGKVRFYANLNTNFLRLTEENEKIWVDNIEKFDIDKKDKFIKSILAHTTDPENRMRLVLLLLRKKDNKVFNLVLQRFVWLIHDFGDSVKKVVESCLDDTIAFEQQFIETFLSYYNQITGFWHKKKSIKEFNPFENQCSYIYKFNELFYKTHDAELRRETEKRSALLQMATKIPIGRGRKFKVGNNDQYSNMGEFKASFLLPRTYFIYPELYDYERRKRLLEDWESNS